MSLSELQELVMDREAWRAVIHGVSKSQTCLSNWTELNWTPQILPLYSRLLVTEKLLTFPKCHHSSLRTSSEQSLLPFTSDLLLYSLILSGTFRTIQENVPITRSFTSVQFSHSVSDSLQLHEPQHVRPPCPSPTAGVYSNSCSLGRWCHLTISSSVVPFSSCLQFFPASGSFQISQFFTTDGQSIVVSASASVLPMNI